MSEAPRKLTPEDLYRMTFLGDVQLSPDGRRLAYVQTEIEEGSLKYRSRIWCRDLTEGLPSDISNEVDPGPSVASGPSLGSDACYPLTTGLGKDGPVQDQSPRWSPDGRAVLFLSKRTSGRTGLWLLPAAKGGEAHRLSEAEKGISSPSWSPDGRHIVYASPGAKNPEEAARRAEERRRLEEEARENPALGEARRKGHAEEERERVRVITRMRYKSNGVGLLPEERLHLWVVDIDGGRSRQITFGAHDESAPAWSPDGREILFSSCRHPDCDLRHIPDLWAVSPAGGEPRRITHGDGPAHAACWSPDGRQVAFIGHDQGETSAANLGVWVVPSGGGEAKNLTAGFEPTAGCHVGTDARYDAAELGPVWSADGEAIYFLATDGGESHLYRVAASGEGTAFEGRVGSEGRVDRVSSPAGGPTVLTSFSLPGGSSGRAAGGDARIVYVAGGADHPCDLYVQTPIPREQPIRLTRVNEQLLSEVQISLPERIEVGSDAGRAIEGWLLKPVGFKPGVRYPLVLEIHGGPHTSYGPVFSHEFQLLASEGYGVLYTNPRGSTGYGEPFTRACLGDWGGGDYEDLMAAVDAAARLPWVDGDRLGVTGGSYGGYMTNWIVGHTDRFKAAVTQRSICNLYSMYGTSDIGFYFNRRELAEADLWQDEGRIMERSPIRYAPHVKTPTLIIHSEEDIRCPMEQAEQWFIALKLNGVETELIRFPGENHELSRSGKPKHRVERLRHILRWMRRGLDVSP